jgi:ATP-binding cassette subfamily B protein
MSSFLPSGALLRRALWPYRLSLACGLFFVLAGAGFTLSWPWLLRQAIDGLVSGEAAERLPWQALGVVALAAGEAISRFTARYQIIAVSRRAEFDLRERLFAHLLRLDALFYQQARTGDLMARATNDLSAVRQLLGPGIQNLFNTLVLFGAALALMASVSLKLALGAALLLPPISLVFGLFRGRIEARYTSVQAQFAAINAQAEENLAGIRVVKAYAQEEREIGAFRRASLAYVERQMEQIRLSGLLWPLMSVLSGTATVMLLYVGGRDVAEGRLTLGQFVQFGAYLSMLTWPMVALGWTMNLFQQGFAALRRVEAVLQAEPRIVDATGDGRRTADGDPVGAQFIAPSAEAPMAEGPMNGAPAMTPVRGAIEYQGIGLRLGGTWLLRDCSFSLPAGGFLGVVGPTGSGKSLLLALLARLYDPTEGRILLDGRELRDWPLATLRRAVGFVPQETLLFSKSLRDNVALGVADPTAERLEQAVALARLEQDLPQLPDGLDTVVGERGVTLSGGQKQRTAIARALLKDPRILVLDDALSAVDAATEAAMLRGLHGFMAQRTSIVATHRLSVVRNADLILVLDGGRIVERGRHDELAARGGLYARLLRRQQLEELLVEEEVQLDRERENGHRTAIRRSA